MPESTFSESRNQAVEEKSRSVAACWLVMVEKWAEAVNVSCQGLTPLV